MFRRKKAMSKSLKIIQALYKKQWEYMYFNDPVFSCKFNSIIHMQIPDDEIRKIRGAWLKEHDKLNDRLLSLQKSILVAKGYIEGESNHECSNDEETSDTNEKCYTLHDATL